ncbi:hypothetical protein KQX64_23320 [Rhodopseudomonas palustris]|nr:hypothetical protein KQX64_23320 [Rhodopseudomonas palustris]
MASAINGKPNEKWLVIHHKDDRFDTNVRMLLAGDPGNVSFLNWGAHDATNDYAEVPNVILAGTLFFRASQYEAIGRASAGFPSSEGLFSKAKFERVRRGEHRHMILQAICRGRVRKCDGARCPPSNVYIIASRRSRIADDLPSIFPRCRVVRWRPEGLQLRGKVADAIAFILERTKDGSFVSDAEVRKHLAMTDKANFRKGIKRHAEFLTALEEEGIVVCSESRLSGFRLRNTTTFWEFEDHHCVSQH